MAIESYSIQWNSHQSELCEKFHDFWTSKHLVDVDIVSGSSIVPAHKLILSACSPYFSRLFEQWKQDRAILFLNDVPAHYVNHILEFMYLGKVEVQERELQDFLKFADSLEIRGLSQKKASNTESETESVIVDTALPEGGEEPANSEIPQKADAEIDADPADVLPKLPAGIEVVSLGSQRKPQKYESANSVSSSGPSVPPPHPAGLGNPVSGSSNDNSDEESCNSTSGRTDTSSCGGAMSSAMNRLLLPPLLSPEQIIMGLVQGVTGGNLSPAAFSQQGLAAPSPRFQKRNSEPTFPTHRRKKRMLTAAGTVDEDATGKRGLGRKRASNASILPEHSIKRGKDWTEQVLSTLFEQRVSVNGITWACKQCPFTNRFRSHAVRHSQKHTGVKHFTCPVAPCDASFIERWMVIQHVQRSHAGEDLASIPVE